MFSDQCLQSMPSVAATVQTFGAGPTSIDHLGKNREADEPLWSREIKCVERTTTSLGVINIHPHVQTQLLYSRYSNLSRHLPVCSHTPPGTLVTLTTRQPSHLGSMSDEVILYDLPSRQGKCWSLNPWKSKFHAENNIGAGSLDAVL